MKKSSTAESDGTVTSSNGTSKTNTTAKKRGRKPGSSSNSRSGQNGNQQIQQRVQQQDSDEAQKSLKGVFEELLKDMYSAEKQLIKALPKMAEAAADEELKDAFETHLEETQRQAQRLEKIFSLVRFDLESKKCEAMEGLIKEGQEVIDTFEEGPVRDAALIIAAQKVEHYEIAAYGSLRTLADTIGYHRAADILDQTLEEEEITDEILNELAEYINEDALYAVEENEI